ncbi:40S ribosomal protein S20-2 [Morella rubra]|uniref:40S ribosomal protein S20-2 n=1 Tax=Morella rubra TaxID=262757 RepID=A0A6A1VS60_9ROSI|nr:40S ribosomal protein S20-2 [Morella rubra]
MAYAMKLPKQQGVEEGQEQIHKIRITLSSKNVKNLEKGLAHGGKTESSGLGDVFDSHTRHLTVPHCTFLRHWERLIDLEAKEIELARDTLSIAFSPTNTMDCTLRSGDYVAHGGKTESSGLGDVFDSHTRHLTVPHCTFLRHWERLIDLEAKEIELARDTLRIAFSPTNTMDCTLRSGDYVSCHLVKMGLVLMVY